jgi:hypothetical protein
MNAPEARPPIKAPLRVGQDFSFNVILPALCTMNLALTFDPGYGKRLSRTLHLQLLSFS